MVNSGGTPRSPQIWRTAVSKPKTSVRSDYTVGYGRPPKGTQFPPGKSGNPTGRRKGSRSVGAILNDVFRQMIEVTENGKTRRVAALEAMACRLRNDALRGDAKAIKLSIELLRRHSKRPMSPRFNSTSCWPRIRRFWRNTFPSSSRRRRETAMIQTTPTKARMFQAILRNDLRAFIHKAF